MDLLLTASSTCLFLCREACKFLTLAVWSRIKVKQKIFNSSNVFSFSWMAGVALKCEINGGGLTAIGGVPQVGVFREKSRCFLCCVVSSFKAHVLCSKAWSNGTFSCTEDLGGRGGCVPKQIIEHDLTTCCTNVVWMIDHQNFWQPSLSGSASQYAVLHLTC